MTDTTETLDGTAVEDPGTDIVPTQQTPPTNLFGTDDPSEVIVRASNVAAALKDVLRAQGMVQNIKGKEYVKVEGWQTLGSMLGVVPVVVWTRPVTGGWEARVEARTLDGRVVGAAEAMCVEAEGGNWGQRATSNARRSMAQTRAVSKSLRGPLGFIVTLAGYQATPAEEIPLDAPAQPDVPLEDQQLTEAQFERLLRAIGAQGIVPTTLLQELDLPLDRALTVAESHQVKAALDARKETAS